LLSSDFDFLLDEIWATSAAVGKSSVGMSSRTGAEGGFTLPHTGLPTEYVSFIAALEAADFGCGWITLPT
jgi:hypothetical protein